MQGRPNFTVTRHTFILYLQIHRAVPSPANPEHRKGCGIPAWRWGLYLVVIGLMIWAGSGPHKGPIPPRVLRKVSRDNAVALVRAVNEYRTEHGRLPVPEHTGLDLKTDTGAASDLMRELVSPADCAAGYSKSFDLSIHAMSNSVQRRYHGLFEIPGKGVALLDTWGRPFLVRLDTNGDGFVADPSAPGTMLNEKVIAWSDGIDGNPNTWDDNAASWQEVR
jgi:hypothetical protein